MSKSMNQMAHSEYQIFFDNDFYKPFNYYFIKYIKSMSV